MRLSPFFLVFLTASTTLGTTYPARGNELGSTQDEQNDLPKLAKFSPVTANNSDLPLLQGTSSLTTWLAVTPDNFKTHLTLEPREDSLSFDLGTAFIPDPPLVNGDSFPLADLPEIEVSPLPQTTVAFPDTAQLETPEETEVFPETAQLETPEETEVFPDTAQLETPEETETPSESSVTQDFPTSPNT
ncbi:hypothetical protein PN462_00200, partial [Spirulina sp. CS-785/01]